MISSPLAGRLYAFPGIEAGVAFSPAQGLE
jgi:hypothetical protein